MAAVFVEADVGLASRWRSFIAAITLMKTLIDDQRTRTGHAPSAWPPFVLFFFSLLFGVLFFLFWLKKTERIASSAFLSVDTHTHTPTIVVSVLPT